ncbi:MULTISPECIES: hypothetical protein [unclassified Shinella]|uniref:hypothetical protein n=1 Tax=unclassified Shinella TaxID=2643062 RepID=UPI00225C6FF8|nr:hypothetical protein SHINE37_44671 [Rhizobiaceae bacterium]CAK7259147.1 protein of unknown function [Shinella sp. WSC3-e]
MAMSIKETFDAKILDIVSITPSSILGEEQYETYLRFFLADVAKEKHAEKLKWYLMRAGMVALINAARGRERSLLKIEASAKYKAEKARKIKKYDAEQKREKNRYAREWMRADKERKEYCNKYSIPLSEYDEHVKTAYCKQHSIPRSEYEIHVQRAQWREQAEKFEKQQADINAAIDNEANKRAAGILSRWLCDGRPLGECSGLDLDRFSDRERRTAAGHTANALFYERLRAFTPDQGTIAENVPPQTLLSVFDETFARDKEVLVAH